MCCLSPTRFGGHPGKVWFEQRAFPQGVARLKADIAHVPYWGPPLRSPAPLVCTVLDVIPLVIPAYRAGIQKPAVYQSGGRGRTRRSTYPDDLGRRQTRHLERLSAFRRRVSR